MSIIAQNTMKLAQRLTNACFCPNAVKGKTIPTDFMVDDKTLPTISNFQFQLGSAFYGPKSPQVMFSEEYVPESISTQLYNISDLQLPATEKGLAYKDLGPNT